MKKRRIWWRQKTAGALAALLIAGAPGMAALTEQRVRAEEGAAMGRYMEQDITPEGGSYIAYGMRLLEDQTLRLLWLDETGDACVMDSHDGGTSWEKTYSLKELLGGADCYCDSAALSPDGGAFFCLSMAEESAGDAQDVEPAGEDMQDVEPAGEDMQDAEPAGEAVQEPAFRYIRLDADGTVSDVSLQMPETGEEPDDMLGYLLRIQYAEDGKFLANMIGGGEYLYLYDDTTGEILRVCNEEEYYIPYFEKAGDSIFAYGNGSLHAIEYESGQYRNVDTAIKEEVEADPENMQIISSDVYPLALCAGRQDGEIYYVTKDGIFRFQEGGSLVEQIVDGDLNSLSKPSVQMISIEAAPDGSLLVLLRDDDQIRLLRYAYDETAPAVPETELYVYSLKEEAEVQQAISQFQSRNPQYYVHYEIGLTGQDAVTASDALRTLNTEIMAGNGPDVLILDGMPVNSYIEKGILQDISGVLAEAAQEELLENITSVYETDGAVYAVPTRFQMPVLIGAPDTLAKITDLASLADTAEQLRAEDDGPEEILGMSSVYWMLRAFYAACSPTLLTEDGSLDKEALTEMITQLARAIKGNRYREEEKPYRMNTTDGGEAYDFSTVSSLYSFLVGETKLEEINMSTGTTLQEVMTGSKMMELDYILAPYADGHVFLPKVIAGVSSQSSQIEGAQAFVAFLLSKEAQSSNQGRGFPVNRAALAAEVGASEDTGIYSSQYSRQEEDGTVTEVMYNVTGLTDAQRKRFLSQTESLDTPALTDAVIQELVLEQAGAYLAGDISAEDAVNAISQKMSLYLAE